MKHPFILAAFVAAVTAVPAQAQPVAADLLPAYEVTTIISSMGMRPIGRPAWAGGRYVVAAIDRHGREVNVVLDARDGQVIAVRPLARNSFGGGPAQGGYPPPYGYPQRGAPYDPMDGRAPPPAMGRDVPPGGMPPGAVPNGPPSDDGEFFDNDQQQGALPAPRPAARNAPPPRDPAVTGSVPRSAHAERREAARDPAATDATPRVSTPMPRPRPALARANDPSNKPAANPEANPGAKPEAAKPADVKPADAKAAASAVPAKPDQAGKPEAANKSESALREIRMIDMSKPPPAKKPEQKPGEAIRF